MNHIANKILFIIALLIELFLIYYTFHIDNESYLISCFIVIFILVFSPLGQKCQTRPEGRIAVSITILVIIVIHGLICIICGIIYLAKNPDSEKWLLIGIYFILSRIIWVWCMYEYPSIRYICLSNENDSLIHQSIEHQSLIVIQPPPNYSTFSITINTEPEPCSICLSEMKRKEKLASICLQGHQFHKMCLDKWVQTKGQKATCPLCRN